jgi:oxysterol-binding protein 1
VAIYSTTLLQCIERNTTKPFNPLLGETFELVTPNFKFIAEQVSHHPPITAFECQGNSGYKVWSNNRAKTKFTGKSLNLIPIYKVYVELLPFNEKYEIQQPTVSAHNLIIGNLYLDLGGKSVIRNCANNEYCELEYHKRGWSSSNSFRVDG